MLTADNLHRLQNGIELGEMPRAFRDVVVFASRLDRAGFVWINSLCIMQGEQGEADWLAAFATMDSVHSESYLNISATHAEHSGQGLFSARRPDAVLESGVKLNVKGMLPTKFRTTTLPSILRASTRPETRPTVLGTNDLRRCLLLDMDSWDNLVSRAPVNKRGGCYRKGCWHRGSCIFAEGRSPGNVSNSTQRRDARQVYLTLWLITTRSWSILYSRTCTEVKKDIVKLDLLEQTEGNADSKSGTTE